MSLFLVFFVKIFVLFVVKILLLSVRGSDGAFCGGWLAAGEEPDADYPGVSLSVSSRIALPRAIDI